MFPYDERPDYALWKRSVQASEASAIDPFAPVRFSITREDRVASAGSCFAAHIAANVRKHNFNYLSLEEDTEFSANFGNVYTTLQLLQLFQRAYGAFTPVERVWPRGDRWVDAFRPRAFADAFATEEDVLVASEAHLAAVRRMFESLDVFVFTLGLTEVFCSTIDGAAYPACPGKDFGSFDPARYSFRNLSIQENVSALDAFLSGLHRINPSARVILTVSPVPLVATMENRSVVQSTVYSKSVLRVCADEMLERHSFVDYFWSYEIITSTYNNDRYFDTDRRTVNESGVSHVMHSFFKHFAGLMIEQAAMKSTDPCDEDVLHKIIKSAYQ